MFWEYAAAPGLSPLARGTPLIRLPKKPFLRFIPAGAGNTFAGFSGLPGSPVYPRWRGEHSPCPRRINLSNGLSPLARGTRWREPQHIAPTRFIPAGAGNTMKRLTRTYRQPVYPRWRGEHSVCGQCSNTAPGLSPLARGTLADRQNLAPS